MKISQFISLKKINDFNPGYIEKIRKIKKFKMNVQSTKLIKGKKSK